MALTYLSYAVLTLLFSSRMLQPAQICDLLKGMVLMFSF